MKNIYSFNISEIGKNHKNKEMPCQDNSAFYESKKMNIITVSDGHGSPDYIRSDKGSKIACEVAISCGIEFVNNIDDNILKQKDSREVCIYQLYKSILCEWNKKIEDDIRNNPFSKEELEKVSDEKRDSYEQGKDSVRAYGCTLILVIYTDNYFIGIRNGDGGCVVLNQDVSFSKPIPWNSKCNFNITTSLCEDTSIEEFRYCYSQEKPLAVFINSDGVDDSCSQDDVYEYYSSCCVDFIHFDAETMYNNIVDSIYRFTQEGFGDDTSIAGIINEKGVMKAKKEVINQQKTMKKERQRRMTEKKQEDLKNEKENLKKIIKKIEEEKKSLEKERGKIIECDVGVLNAFLKRNDNKSIEEINSRIIQLENKLSSLYVRLHSNDVKSKSLKNEND